MTYQHCPVCQGLIAPDDLTCRICRAPVADRGAPADAWPAPGAAPVASTGVGPATPPAVPGWVGAPPPGSAPPPGWAPPSAPPPYGSAPPPGYAPPSAPPPYGSAPPAGYAPAPGFAPPPGSAPPGSVPPPGYALPPGYAQPGYGAPGYGPPPAKKSKLVPIVSVVMVVLVLGAGAAIFGINRAKGPRYPDAWDPRVQYAVSFIEGEKGRPFEHPVFITFLSDDAFKKQVAEPTTSPTDEQRKQVAQQTGMLRALGLVQGDVDLLKEQSNLSSEGTAAYYDPPTKTVYVRGTDLNEAVKGTIVHELTHAWQDQYYDLGRLPRLEGQQKRDAFRALAEGDAVNSEDAWIASLSATDKAAYDAQSKKDGATATAGIKSVPDILVADFGAPYSFGPSFMQGMQASGGLTRVDSTFADPPVDDFQIMHPWAYLAGRGAPASVAKPDTGGAATVDDGTYGALFWYLTMADRIDPHVALQAIDGWGGDAYAVYEEGGAVCVKASVVGTDQAATASLAGALTQWGATLPNVEVAARSEAVDVKACDPGPTAQFGYAGRSSKVIALPVVRAIVWSQLLQQGEPAARADCMGNAFVANMTLEDVSSSSVTDQRRTELRNAAQAACPR